MTRDREGDRVRQTGHVPRGMAVPRRVWRGVGARGWQAPCPLPSAAQAARPRCRPGTASRRKKFQRMYTTKKAPYPPYRQYWNCEGGACWRGGALSMWLRCGKVARGLDVGRDFQ